MKKFALVLIGLLVAGAVHAGVTTNLTAEGAWPDGRIQINSALTSVNTEFTTQEALFTAQSDATQVITTVTVLYTPRQIGDVLVLGVTNVFVAGGATTNDWQAVAP